MSTDTVEARKILTRLDGKALKETATTYLLGTLELDTPDEVREAWRESFPREEERADAERAVNGLSDPERDQLLRLAMLRTLEDRPETAPLFTASIEQAGRSMWVVETVELTLSATMLLREYFRKGRSREVHRREITEPDGRKIVEVNEIQYLADGPLARLLAKLGLSTQAP
jgi:hypothetical protein